MVDIYHKKWWWWAELLNTMPISVLKFVPPCCRDILDMIYHKCIDIQEKCLLWFKIIDLIKMSLWHFDYFYELGQTAKGILLFLEVTSDYSVGNPERFRFFCPLAICGYKFRASILRVVSNVTLKHVTVQIFFLKFSSFCSNTRFVLFTSEPTFICLGDEHQNELAAVIEKVQRQIHVPVTCWKNLSHDDTICKPFLQRNNHAHICQTRQTPLWAISASNWELWRFLTSLPLFTTTVVSNCLVTV